MIFFFFLYEASFFWTAPGLIIPRAGPEFAQKKNWKKGRQLLQMIPATVTNLCALHCFYILMFCFLIVEIFPKF
jgi:hypothetical protein